MSKLELLMNYWQTRRQVGHTTLQMMGVIGVPYSGIFVTADRKLINDKMLQRGNGPRNSEITFVSMDWLTEKNLNYSRLPIAVDHFVLQHLFHEHNNELYKRWHK